MPRREKKRPKPDLSKLPWDAWIKPGELRLRKGRDFWCDPQDLANEALRQATLRSLRLHTHWDADSNELLVEVYEFKRAPARTQ